MHILEAMAQDLTLVGFAILMIIFVGIDIASFHMNRHVDCKGILTSLGILGTFMGIFQGLMQFDVADIRSSVPKLLDGLKFAFATSVLGLLLATCTHIWQIIWYDVWQHLLRQEDQTESPPASLENVITQVQRIQGQLAILHEYVYAARHQFSKLDINGVMLPDDATNWVAVRDHNTQLVWEYKNIQDKIRDYSQVFTWKDAAMATYQDEIRRMKLAGFTDWRLLSIAELRTVLRYPGPDQRFFGPLTNSEQPLPLVFSQEEVNIPIKSEATESTSALGWAVARESGLQVATTKAHIWLVRGGKL